MNGNRGNPSTDPRSLNQEEKDNIYKDLFSPTAGIGLRILRQPMGTSDFRWGDYSYQDNENLPLSLERDQAYILPTLAESMDFNPNLQIYSLPWSPPGWMKKSGHLNGSTMKGQYFDQLGTYFADYVEAMASEGYTIHYLSIQNEPQHTTGQYPSMGMTPWEHAQAAVSIRAALEGRGYTGVKLVAYEHNWDNPEYALEVLASAETAIDAVAFHCYAGDPSAQSIVHDVFPDKEIYLTEATEFGDVTSWNGDFRWALGNLVIGAVQNWASTVMEFNFVLYESGPKAPGGCENCRGIIDVNPSGGYTKNPAYYALGHLSKFAAVGCRRIESLSPDDKTKTLAMKNPAGSPYSIFLIILNNSGDNRNYFIYDMQNNPIEVLVPAWSAVTVAETASGVTEIWGTFDDNSKRLEVV